MKYAALLLLAMVGCYSAKAETPTRIDCKALRKEASTAAWRKTEISQNLRFLTLLPPEKRGAIAVEISNSIDAIASAKAAETIFTAFCN